MRKFVKKHKVELIIVLAVLLLAIPFIWPFLLSILWNVMGVVLPVVAAMILSWLYDNRKDFGGKWQKSAGSRIDSYDKRQFSTKRADYWYTSYGKKRLIRLAEELKREGYSEVWIHPDGVCKVKTDQGYRRRATLAEYPANYAGLIAEKLCADGIQADMRGRYLYLSFQKSRRTA